MREIESSVTYMTFTQGKRNPGIMRPRLLYNISKMREIGNSDPLIQGIEDGDTLQMDTVAPRFPFGEIPGGFDESYWKEVAGLEENDIPSLTARRTVHLRRLEKNCKTDLLVELLTKRRDDYRKRCSNRGDYGLFLFELSRLVKIILEEDFAKPSPQYVKLLEMEDGSSKSVLHIVAAIGLLLVIIEILDYRKDMCVLKSHSDGHLPLYYSLVNGHDQASMLLIKAMDNRIVRNLFIGDEICPPQFSFGDLISCGNMKKTVEAVLDCCMSPAWPFVPISPNDVNGVTIPDFPYFYNFYYRILDGDENGENGFAMQQEGKRVSNGRFTSKNKTCFQLIAENFTEEDDIMRHPLVKKLMMNKWEAFGKFYVRAYFLLYILFLFVMSISFLLEPSTGDRRKYSHPKDYFRMACEIATIAATLCYIISEIDQLIQEKSYYFRWTSNYFDVLGLVMILIVIPLRFTPNPSAEFAVSAAAYALNFLRICNYFCAFRGLSIYGQTFRTILYKDISKFMMLFLIFMLGFAGTVYLLYKSTEGENYDWSGEDMLTNRTNILGLVYGFLLIKELSGIASGSEFIDADHYFKMHFALVLLMLANMFFVIVVLNNMLIGQISDRYDKAKSNATIKYDIDRLRYLAVLERGNIFYSQSFHSKHYTDGEYVHAWRLLGDLMEDSAMLNKKEEERVRSASVKARMMEKCKIPSTAYSKHNLESW